MQARRLRRQRRRRSKMSNNPKDPWDELEGRFFKVDVGSTTEEAITNDYNTSEPVVHYTTDGNIVFNGMKFCKQKEDAVSSDKRIVVHKVIPMLPRKGYIYCFQGRFVFFKMECKRINEDGTYNIPLFIDSVTFTNSTFINVLTINEIYECRGTTVTGKFLKQVALKYDAVSFLFRVSLREIKSILQKRDEAIYLQIVEEINTPFGILNTYDPTDEHISQSHCVTLRSKDDILRLGYEIISPYFKLSDVCNNHYKYGTFEDFKAAAEREQGVNARIYRMRRCKHRFLEKKEDGSIYFTDGTGKKEYVLKKKRLYKGIVFYRDGRFYGINKDGSERDLYLRNYLIQYTKEEERNSKKKMTYTRNLIKVFYPKNRRK